MNSFNSDYFIHGANVLLLLAYSVRDIPWLRLFALASSLIAMPYFFLQPTPLWAPLCWSTLFAAINLFQPWRLFVERRPVKLTPEEGTRCRLFGFGTSESVAGSEHRVLDHCRDRRATDRARQNVSRVSHSLSVEKCG
jgi:hypothetical protein